MDRDRGRRRGCDSAGGWTEADPASGGGLSIAQQRRCGWEAGTRTPIRNSRGCSLTIRRPPKGPWVTTDYIIAPDMDSLKSFRLKRLDSELDVEPQAVDPDRTAVVIVGQICVVLEIDCRGEAGEQTCAVIGFPDIFGRVIQAAVAD